MIRSVCQFCHIHSVHLLIHLQQGQLGENTYAMSHLCQRYSYHCYSAQIWNTFVLFARLIVINIKIIIPSIEFVAISSFYIEQWEVKVQVNNLPTPLKIKKKVATRKDDGENFCFILEIPHFIL